MQAIILAAGKGSRLHPITLKRTKAMLPIAGKPMVARVMDAIAAHGIRDFVIVASPEDADIVEYFGGVPSPSALPRGGRELENPSPGGRGAGVRENIRFVFQSERKGMAHALSLATPLINEDFILSACDNLVSEQDIALMLEQWHTSPKPDAILSLLTVSREQILKSGMVMLEGKRVAKIIEKPQPEEIVSEIASLPLYLFSTKILSYLPKVQPSPRGEYELQDAIQMMIADGCNVRGETISGRLTVTMAADLLAVNQKFMSGKEYEINAKYKNIKIIQPVLIEENVVIGNDCEIGPDVYIERNCEIGEKVKISRAIVLRGAKVEGNRVIEDVVVS